MYSDIAIKVSDVSKHYRIYDKPIDRLKQSLLLGKRQYYTEFKALDNVSFEVKRGETVGIIGQNGSGKSTLLQIICGTLTPTAGNVVVNGRIAALLELGAGFNPEFTGRENVYMNATILGLSKEDIDAKYDEILAFADIGDFVNQPVKTYSSGMQIRLAFAVAINVDPEILIIDEALSVGDELFQRKCFSRIELIRANGATILFVSHSGAQVIELCDRVVLLDGGENLAVGVPKQIVGSYQKLLYAPEEQCDAIREQIRQSQKQASSIESMEDESCLSADSVLETEESYDPNLKPSSTIEYESHGAYIEDPRIINLAGEQVNNLIHGMTYRYVYMVRFTKSANNVRFGMLIKTTSGFELGGSSSANSLKDSLFYVQAGSYYRVEFRFRCVLNSSTYFLNAGVTGNVDGSETFLHRLIDIAMFRVMGDPLNLATGIVDFNCKPEFQLQRKSK